jgi:hypothetical protein
MEVSGHFQAPAALIPEMIPPLPIVQEAGWPPQPVWTLWRRQNHFPLPGIKPRDFSRSLYRLSYPGSLLHEVSIFIFSDADGSWYYGVYVLDYPIVVAARCKAWTVFARSDAGIVDSNPTQGMDVCVRLFCVCVVLCVGRGLATAWSPGPMSPTNCV